MKRLFKNIASIFAIAAVLTFSVAAVGADTIKHRGETITYERFVEVETGSGNY